MILKKIIFTITLSLSSICIFAQSQKEINQFQNLFVPKVKANEYKQYTQKNKNELQLFFSGLFLFYKKCISSQDGQSCSFTPSCSEYGILAVKKHGILGIFNTFDRLTRCHGLYRHKYPIHPKTHLQHDPG